MCELGAPLSAAERAEFDSSIPDDITIVWGQDWDGNPAPRAVPPGMGVCLIGKFGEGFDVRGPQVSACGECGELIMQTGGGVKPMQDHLWQAHQISAPVLPK